jgi:hypothetical protein
VTEDPYYCDRQEEIAEVLTGAGLTVRRAFAVYDL